MKGRCFYELEKRREELLQLDLGADFLQLGLHSLGLVLGDTLLQGSRSALDSGLSLSQALAGDLTDSLDDLDLASSVEASQDDCLLYTSSIGILIICALVFAVSVFVRHENVMNA